MSWDDGCCQGHCFSCRHDTRILVFPWTIDSGETNFGGRSMKLKEEEFDRIVNRALGRIPPEIRNRMENIVISVQKRPSPELLESMEIPPDETLFGIFEGVPLSERSVMDPPLYPDTIFIFQEPLETEFSSQHELEEQIEITVVHEVAHYLGMSEEELEELGYA
ncbi:MAG TPA: metallopeptidase family protein [Desulfobacteraceae bacterium]|nr:metallopeptidase family protein [Desulfobacteraceae bacterium]